MFPCYYFAWIVCVINIFSEVRVIESAEECLLIDSLKFHLNFECIIWARDNSNPDYRILPIRCPNLMATWMTLRRNICKEVRRTCPLRSRQLVIPSEIPPQSLQKIDFERCNLDNLFIYFWDDEKTNFDSALKDVYINVNCRFIIAKRLQSNGYELMEVFRYEAGATLQIVHLGEWNIADGFNNFTKLENVYQQRNNFQGTKMKIGMFNALPYTYMKIQNNSKITLKGIIPKIWMLTSECLNIKSEYSERKRNLLHKNGTWSGLVKDIQALQVNIGMPFANQKDYLPVVDLLAPIIKERVSMFFRRDQIPKKEAEQWSTYILPFHRYLWISLIALILILAIWDNFLCGKLNFLAFLESIYFHFGMQCLQGSSYDVKLTEKLSGRVSLIFYSFFTLIIYISFSSCIISFLISPASELIFNNLKGFLNTGGYTIHCLSTTPFLRLIRASSDPVLHRLYKEYLEPGFKNFPKSSEVGKIMESRPKYGFISSEIRGKELFRSLGNNLFYFPVFDQPSFLTISVNKNLPYRRFFNHKIHLFYETGIRQYIDKLYREEPLKEEEEDFESIHLKTLIMPFVILIAGYLISIVLLIIEIFINKRFKA